MRVLTKGRKYPGDPQPAHAECLPATARGTMGAPCCVDTTGIPNNHLQYVVTWLGLAIVWLGMTAYWMWRIWRRKS